MTAYPEKVESWRTSDGMLYSSEWAAQMRQKDIDDTTTVNARIEAGDNLLAALGALGHGIPDADAELAAQITKHSLLIISHWQCREQPGYQLIRMNVGGSFFVHGHAGSWSGPYGNNVSLRDMLYYARDTMTRCGGKLPVLKEADRGE